MIPYHNWLAESSVGFALQAIGASERVLQHLNDPPAPQIASGAKPAGIFRGEVEFKNVHYVYSNRWVVVNNSNILHSLSW